MWRVKSTLHTFASYFGKVKMFLIWNRQVKHECITSSNRVVEYVLVIQGTNMIFKYSYICLQYNFKLTVGLFN